MIDCVSDAEIGAAALTTANASGAQDGASSGSFTRMSQDQEVRTVQEGRRQERVIEQLRTAINPDDRPVTESRRLPQHEIDRMVDQALEGADARQATQQLIEDSLGTIETEYQTGWLNLTTNFTKWFKDSAGDLYNWFARFAPQRDRSLADNIFINEQSILGNKIEAVRQDMFNKLIAPLIRDIHPIARRLGLSDTEVLQLGGRYANTLHAPEANARVLEHWHNDYAALEQELIAGQQKDPLFQLSKRKRREMADLQKKIDDLEFALDNPDAVNPEEVASYGILDWEVDDIRNAIFKTGITEEECNFIAQRLTQISEGEGGIREQLLRGGILSPEEAAGQPDFEHYVPAITNGQIRSGVANDSNLFNPGGFYAREGRKGGELADGFTATLNYIDRAARNLGSVRYGDMLNALFLIHQSQGIDSGLRRFDYDKIMGLTKAQVDPELRRVADHYLNNGGIVARIAETDKNGNVRYKRYIFGFDPNWQDPSGRFTGMDLNNAIAAPMRSLNTAQTLLAKATSLQGQMVTRFRPLFAPVAMTRDVFERMFDMAGSTYITESGERISGAGIATKMLFNQMPAMVNWFRYNTGMAEAGSLAAKYGEEFDRLGLRQNFIRLSLSTDRPKNLVDSMTAAKLPEMRSLNDAPWLKQALANTKYGADKILSGLDKWNDYWNNGAAYNQYTILRNSGLSEASARDATLRFMNLRQQGTATPTLRVLYPFVKPTIQSASSVLRTLGFAYDPRGFFHVDRVKTYGFVLGSLIAAEFIKDMATAMLGEDDRGNNKIDAFTVSKLSSGIPFPVGDGNFAWLNTGYGLPAVALSLVWNKDRMQRGLISPSEMASEVLFTFTKNMAPGNFPEFSAAEHPSQFLLQTFAPAVITPFVQEAMNMNRYGRDIYSKGSDSSRPQSDQGGVRASRIYHQLAKVVYDYTGIDYSPESIQHIVQGYLTGPLRFLRTAWEGESEGRAQTDIAKKEALHPMFEALGVGMHGGVLRDPATTMFFQAKNAFDDRIKEEHINLRSHGRDVKGAKLAEFKRQTLLDAGWTPEEVEDYLTVDEVTRALTGKSTEINKQLRAEFLSADDSSTLMDRLNEYYTNQRKMHADAVSKLNIYHPGGVL